MLEPPTSSSTLTDTIMANRQGYDVVVDVDAEVYQTAWDSMATSDAETLYRATLAIPTSKKITWNSTTQVYSLPCR